MASKRAPKASADNEIDELFADIDTKPTKPSATTTTTTTGGAGGSGKAPASAKPKASSGGDDILAELETQLGDKAPSRPHTPRITTTKQQQRASLEQPPSATGPPRKSAESTRSLHASFTPTSDVQEAKAPVEQQPQAAAAAAGGGWWGALTSTATAAIKQAEAAVKEIQQNEEAKKWADQVRGNVGALRGLGKLG